MKRKKSNARCKYKMEVERRHTYCHLCCTNGLLCTPQLYEQTRELRTLDVTIRAPRHLCQGFFLFVANFFFQQILLNHWRNFEYGDEKRKGKRKWMENCNPLLWMNGRFYTFLNSFDKGLFGSVKSDEVVHRYKKDGISCMEESASIHRTSRGYFKWRYARQWLF